jgi:cleavage and polyadenylation specificity factor subunit 2
MLNYVSTSSVEFAKSMLEWMSDAIVKKFDNNRENQFNFRQVSNNGWIYTRRLTYLRSFVKTITSIEELNSLPKPSVVVTSFPSLECGFARDLFIKWASDPKNLLLFPDKSTLLCAVKHPILTIS